MKPESNGNFGIPMWPMHSGDMLAPHNPGRGTLLSFNGFTGVDDGGIFVRLSQFHSWLDDSPGASVPYDTTSTFSRKTTLTQVAGVTAATLYATHRLQTIAIRLRNTKDYPNGAFPPANAIQYAYARGGLD